MAAAPNAPAESTKDSGDLSLVRTAQATMPPQTVPPQVEAVDEGVFVEQSFPQDGALVDRFDEGGALLDEVEQQKRVFAQMLRREVENTVIDARRTMANDPDAAGQQLKLTLQNVERAPELNPDVRSQLIDKLQIALREVQRQASIKDELDAAREEQLAAARERQLLNERLAARHRAREATQSIASTRSSMSAATTKRSKWRDIAPRDGSGRRSPADAWPRPGRSCSGTITWREVDSSGAVARLLRWTRCIRSKTSSVPFPDDPPIVYPDAPFWEELTIRRKKFASMDLKAGEAPKSASTMRWSPAQGDGPGLHGRAARRTCELPARRIRDSDSARQAGAGRRGLDAQTSR